jgi:hypothetical protein
LACDPDGQQLSLALAKQQRGVSVRVTVLEPLRRMVWTGGLPFGLFTGRRTFRLTPRDGGIVEFTMHCCFRNSYCGTGSSETPFLVGAACRRWRMFRGEAPETQFGNQRHGMVGCKAHNWQKWHEVL